MPDWPDVSVRILLITRAARFDVLKNFMNGINSGTSNGMMYFRHRVLAVLRDHLLHLLELAAVAADQDDRAIFGQFECRGATDAGGRAGDDVGLAI